jgi:acyl carrier protein
MTTDEIRQTVLHALGAVAPEANTTRLQADVNLREHLDIDLMDFLEFVIALHRELQIEIPEADYPKLTTLAGCVAYVKSALGDKTC